MSDEILYIGKNNYIERTLYTKDKSDDTETLYPNVDTATTRAKLVLYKNSFVVKEFDSGVTAALFDWTLGGSVIRFIMGNDAWFVDKEGIEYNAVLVLYDAVNTDGLQFTPFSLKISKPKV